MYIYIYIYIVMWSYKLVNQHDITKVALPAGIPKLRGTLLKSVGDAVVAGLKGGAVRFLGFVMLCFTS